MIMHSSYWPSCWSLCYHPTDHYATILVTVLLIIMLPSYWSLCYHPTDHYASILLIIMLPSYWPSYRPLCYHPTDRPTDHYATTILTILLIIMLQSYYPTDHYAFILLTDLLIIMLPSYWPSYWLLCFHSNDYVTILRRQGRGVVPISTPSPANRKPSLVFTQI